MKPGVSVIIVSYKVRELLKKCLMSVLKFADAEIEIIVVDNASADGTVEMIKNEFPQVRLINPGKNLGFAAANNLGIKSAVGRHYLLLNPDTEFISAGLEQLVSYLDQHQNCGVLGCRLLNSDKSLQPSVRRFPSLTNHILMMFKLHHLMPLKKYLAADFDYNQIGEPQQVMGAFFLINGRNYPQIGELDEGYYIWFEEVDYCCRTLKKGFKVIYNPALEIVHHGGQSFGSNINFKKQMIYSKSRLRYIRKHQGLTAFLIILILTPISLFLTFLAGLLKS